MSSLRNHARRVCGTAALMVLGVGCSESRQSTGLQNPAPVVEAVLVVSNLSAPAGAPISVFVKANATASSVGSYTARIKYDPQALRFDGEAVIDKELRAINPAPGLIRIAGVAPKGFADGLLAGYTFVVLQANGAKSLSLIVDEMHMVSHVDAKTDLVIAPTRTTSR